MIRERPRVAWRVLIGLAAVKLAVHVAASQFAYGYMTDELYYLDSTDRLDWGYVDHPPFSIALLALVRSTLGESILAIRCVPALLGAAMVLLIGLMAREMGGGRAAQGLAALATLMSPIYLGIGGFYSMNAIDAALWPLAMLFVLRLINGADPRLWLALGTVLGVGLLNKLSVMWFGFGLFVGLLLTPERRWFATPWPWLAGVIALACLAPHLWWQVGHDFPFLEFNRNAARYKVGSISPLAFASRQLLIMNPIAAPFWVGGLAYVFAADRARAYRPVAWIWVAVFGLLITTGTARIHYLAPAYGVALAAGGVAVERLARREAWRRLTAATALGLTAAGLLAMPLALPLLPPKRLVALIQTVGFEIPQERDKSGVLPINLALQFHPRAVLEPVLTAYLRLSPADRARVGILTGGFGETGAINVLGRSSGLPRSVGYHNHYWMWGPGDETGELMIVVHESEAQLREWFAEVERVGEIECEYCMPALSAKSVYLCGRPRRPLAELWPELKSYW
jgi:hypothetical protein